jgi:hypothetical protein
MAMNGRRRKLKTRSDFAIFAVVCACVITSIARAEEVSDATLRFSLTIPQGFQRDPKVVGAKPDFIYAFRKAGSRGIDTLIIVERLRAVIGREHFDAAQITAAHKQARMLTFPWRGFDVDALEIPEQVGAVRIVHCNVQMPLKPEAIQIDFIGPQDEAAKLKALAEQVVASVKGESNWLASSAPPIVARSNYYGAILLGTLAAAVAAGLVLLWLVRRHSWRGTVLVLAVLIYAASWALAPGETREMRGAVGVLRMLGFLGLLLGLYDLFRHPTRKPPVQKPPAETERREDSSVE